MSNESIMIARHFTRLQWIVAFSLTPFVPSASAQRTANAANPASSNDTHWVATWASAQQQPAAGRGGGGGRGPGAGGPVPGTPGAAGAQAPPAAAAAPPAAAAPVAGTLVNQTARM